MKLEGKQKKLYKKENGISLIVLVITIIVIIILATAIILTLTNNNPISEANKARYESDRDNMQSIFTNTVAKVMAVNQGSIKIEAGSLNSVKSGVSSTTGIVNYTLDEVQDSSKSNGTIEFDNKENVENKYYTGKKLPIYKAGETIWSVDEEGILKLSVNGKEYNDNSKNDGGGSSSGETTNDGVTISKEEYENIKKTMKEVETLKTKIENMEKQSKNIDRVNLMNELVDIPLTTTWVDKDFADITLSDSIENYKYLEINIELKRENGGVLYEKTEIISTNNLKYNNSNTNNWDDGSIFSLNIFNVNHRYCIVGWLKNNNLLHIGSAQTNDERGKYYFRIKNIYGIR